MDRIEGRNGEGAGCSNGAQNGWRCSSKLFVLHNQLHNAQTNTIHCAYVLPHIPQEVPLQSPNTAVIYQAQSLNPHYNPQIDGLIGQTFTISGQDVGLITACVVWAFEKLDEKQDGFWNYKFTASKYIELIK